MSFNAWIKTPGVDRCYLVEFQARNSGELITIRRATHPYRSGPTDEPALTPYQETILSMGVWSRELTSLFTGFSTLTLSSIELFMDDELSELIESANVAGLPVVIRCGDARWPLSDFGIVATATAKDLVAASYNTAKLSFNDAAELFRRQLQTAVVVTGPNAGEPQPICLGRCFNVSPIMLSEATRTYQVHDGAIHAITAVRENGVSIPFTADLSTGTFTLTNNASGRITADVDGAKPSGTWLQNAAQMITYLTGRFGFSVPAGLSALPTYQLGYYITGDKTLSDALDDISASVGAAWHFSRTGQLKWMHFNGPSVSEQTLTSDDIEDDTLYPRRRIAPAKSVALGYRRNWTPQADGLAGSVRETMPELAALYEKEESTVKAPAPDVLTSYPDATDIVSSTLIVQKTDAQTEAERRAVWASVPHHVYELSAFAAPFALDLGQTISIQYPRYFSGSGLPVVITRLSDDLMLDTCTVEVIR